MKFRKSYCLSLVLGAVGCGAGADETSGEPVASTEAPIIGGSAVPSDNPAPFSSVVNIGGCSATKINARRFLTAGHCYPNVFPVKGSGAKINITNTLDSSGGVLATVDRFHIHPNWEPNRGNVTYDAGILEVSTSTPAVPVISVDAATATAVPDGTILTLAGYGCTTPTGAGGGTKKMAQLATMSLAQLQATDTAISNNADVYAHFYPFNGGLMNPNSFTQVCGGDSGGGVFRFTNTWRLAGINALQGAGQGTNPRTALSFATHVPELVAWTKTPTGRNNHGSIANALTGLCLSVGSNVTAGSGVVEEVCGPATTSANPQFWTITPVGPATAGQVQLKSGKTGLCLDGSGGLVRQMACNTTSSDQMWGFISFSTPVPIVNAASQKRLGVFGSNGVDLALSETNNRQSWIVVQ